MGGERRREVASSGSTPRSSCRLVDKLRAAGRLDILKLIHFHLGSQITDIRYIKTGLQEIARFYAELRALGVDITHVDVGGGLGVDYDGTSSTSHASVNYSLQEYANDVIYTLAEACREHELPMPHIISESGRALTAHHALLLLKRDRRRVAGATTRCPSSTEDDHALLHEMAEDYASRREADLEAARARGLPRRDVRQGARAASSSTAACSRCASARIAEQIYLATINAIAQHRRAATATSTRTSSPISTRRSSIATSATSRSSSRCPTAGRSTSSSRSCRSTGWTRSRRAAGRCRT